MARPTPETMLISSLINGGDPTVAQGFGITPEKFHGFRDEFEWLLDYHKRFGGVPTPEKMAMVYPEFPFSEGEDDPRWPASEVQDGYATRMMKRNVVKASMLIDQGKTQEAYQLFEGLKYSQISEKPLNLLDDPNYFEDYENTNEVRITLPWATPQGLTGGVGPGELWYFLARQGHGKSGMLIDMAADAVMAGHSVLFFALEMTKRQMQVRLHAALGRRLGWGNKIDAYAMLHRQYDNKLYRKLMAEINEAVTGEMHIHDLTMGFVSPGTVMNRAGDYDMVMVDHTGLMRTEAGARSLDDWRNAAIISNGLKEVAGARLARIVAAVQINREGDTMGWKPPKLKHAAQSDSIGQDADVAITMKRYGKLAAVMSLEKNRHGDSGKFFWANYGANTGDYTEITRDAADAIKDNDDDDDD